MIHFYFAVLFAVVFPPVGVPWLIIFCAFHLYETFGSYPTEEG